MPRLREVANSVGDGKFFLSARADVDESAQVTYLVQKHYLCIVQTTRKNVLSTLPFV